MSSEWYEVSLSELADINPRRTISKGTSAKFIDMAALPIYGRDIDVKDVIFREYKSGGAKFRNGDTLLARITPCLENGKTAHVSCLNGSEFAFGSTEFIVLGPKSEDDSLFLYYLVRSEEFRTYAISRMEGTSGRQRVPNSAVSEYRFLCPPPRVRSEIGQILGCLDDRIRLLRETNSTLEAIAQALFKSWFVDYDPVRANLGTQAPSLPSEVQQLFPFTFTESPQGLIPEGWRVCPLDDTAHFLNGLALQKFPPIGEEFLPVIKIAQLRKGDTSGADRASRDLKTEYIIQDGDVLFSWSGSLEVAIWCGGAGALNQHLFKVTSDKYPKWFYFLWTKYHLPNFRQIAASKATTMGHIQRKHLTEASVVIPPDNVLRAANDVFAPLIEAYINNGIQAYNLASLRDTLLPRLISGQLLIPEAEQAVEEFID